MELTDKQMRKIRGKEIGMIFQDPMTFLNPTMQIGKQIMESISKHTNIKRNEAYDRALEMLKLVEIPNPERRMKQYPYELSGGMRQRVIIAIAMVNHPKLLIADEPTTALDVTIQAEIIDLLKSIQKKTQTSIILITHDLGVVAKMADTVLVFYAGKIVESANVRELFYHTKHPYTWGLLKSLPTFEMKSKGLLYSIDGSPPDLFSPPVGCGFAARCEYAMGICKCKYPESVHLEDGHEVACWMLNERAEAARELAAVNGR